VTRPAAAQRLRPRPTCGEITGHHSLANASENSCVTLSVIGSNSPGRPFSLPRHMAPAEWRKPGMPGICMGKFNAWQISANQSSTTLVTNTVTNPDPCHGTGLSALGADAWRARGMVGGGSRWQISQGARRCRVIGCVSYTVDLAMRPALLRFHSTIWCRPSNDK